MTSSHGSFKVSFLGTKPMTWTPQSRSQQAESQPDSLVSSLSSLGETPTPSQFEHPGPTQEQSDYNSMSESSESEDEAAFRATVPTDAKGLRERFFTEEPRYRWQQLSQDDYPSATPGVIQKTKQRLAGLMVLGQDHHVVGCQPAQHVLGPIFVQGLTPAEYQRELDRVFDKELAVFTDNLHALWANANETIDVAGYPLSGLHYNMPARQQKGKGKKRPTAPTVPTTPSPKRTTHSSGTSPSTSIAAGQTTSVTPTPMSGPQTQTPSGASHASSSVPQTPVKTSKDDDDDDEKAEKSKLKQREKDAQKAVVNSYGQKAADSGCRPAVGAHILSKGLKLNEAKLDLFWQILRGFFSPKFVIDLNKLLQDRPEINIFPLSPTAHKMWDDLLFALRPIQDPDCPNTVMYLQFNFELGIDVETGKKVPLNSIGQYGIPHTYKIEGGDNQGCEAFLFHHGDVIQVEALDPDRYPLASFAAFQTQYSLHQYSAAFKAGGQPQDLFRGPPPRGPPTLRSQQEASVEEEELLEYALEEGIITSKQADMWRGEYLRCAEERADAAFARAIAVRKQEALVEAMWRKMDQEREDEANWMGEIADK